MTPLRRREFIRQAGLSAAVLPFIVGLPSLALAAPARPRQRLIVVFSPNGTIPPAFWPDEIGVDWNAYPNIRDWLARIAATPRFKPPYELMPGHPRPASS